MDQESFVQYWYNEDVHDGRVHRLFHNSDELTVEIDTHDGRRVTFEFSGVESVIGHRPEGMLLYSLTEMKNTFPQRKFVFTNSNEDDEARLEIQARDLLRLD